MTRVIRTVVALLLLSAFSLSTAGAQAPESHAATVHAVHNHHLGKILADTKGMTLYHFTPDKHNKSNCVGVCSRIWPPLLLAKGTKKPSKAAGIPGKLGSIARGNRRQVTYNGKPLYTYSKDKKAGQTTGEGFEHIWYVMKAG